MVGTWKTWMTGTVPETACSGSLQRSFCQLQVHPRQLHGKRCLNKSQARSKLVAPDFIITAVTLWWTNIAIENDPVEIVDFPIKNGGSFHCKLLVHQRVHEFPIETSVFAATDHLRLPTLGFSAAAMCPAHWTRSHHRNCAKGTWRTPTDPKRPTIYGSVKPWKSVKLRGIWGF